MSERAKPDLAQIFHSAKALEAAPGDLPSFIAVVRGLAALGATECATRGYVSLGGAAADAGQLPLALACVKELEALRAPEAEELVRQLAHAYGAGSKRVDPEYRLGPPVYTRSVPALGGTPPHATEVRRACETALAVAETAAAKVSATRPRLPQLPLFHALEEGAFAQLTALMALERQSAGAVVIEQDAPAASFYIIARGRVRIEQSQTSESGKTPPQVFVLSHLGAGAFFGEMALLGDGRRIARAVCETEADLFRVERVGLENLVSEVPRLAEVLAEHCRDRLLANLMVTSSIFRELEPAERLKLQARFARKLYAEGDKIIEEGAEGDGIYVLVSGAVEVLKRDAEGEKVLLSRLGPGDVFGEMSLLGRRPAQARIRAAEKTAVLHLAREVFDEVAAQYPKLLGHLYQLQVAREKDNLRLLAAEPIEADDYLI